MYVAEGVEDDEVNDRIIFPLPWALETYMYYSVCYNVHLMNHIMDIWKP